jgi:hypothetical protein
MPYCEQAGVKGATTPVYYGREPRNSSREALLLSAGLLDYGGDMKPCHIGMGVVIREKDEIGPFGIYSGMVRSRNGVFTAIARSDRERRKWRAVQ